MRRFAAILGNWASQICRNRQGQDLIEYALTVGFVAIAAMAFFPPAIAPAISQIFSKITVLLSQALG